MTTRAIREIVEMRRERDRALDAQSRFACLARSSHILSESLDYDETLATVAAMALPHLGAWCIVDVVEDERLRRVAVVHPDPDRQALARELYERYPPEADDVMGVKRVIDKGQSEIVSEIGDGYLRQAARDEEHLRLMRELGIEAFMTVPLRARGRTLGAMSFVTSEAGRAFGEADLLLAEDLARRCAVTLDNARLYRSAHAARMEADLAARQREELIAIVSHDLRSPIHAIRLQTALLLADDAPSLAPERQRLAVQRIRQTLDGMEKLMQSLLDMHRLDAGTVLPVNPRPTPVAPLLEEVCALFRTEAESRGIALECPLTDRALRVQGDPERLLQVLSNLLANALKFGDEGGHVELVAEEEDGMACFRVTDAGPGIPKDELPHLFDPYWQASRNAGLGSGLGLYIGKAIVESLGGAIDVESTEGVGTTFRFTVPLAPPREVRRPAGEAGADYHEAQESGARVTARREDG